MDERILVRADEELPSDEKYAVRLVEVKHTMPEFNEKLDEIEQKIDALASNDDGIQALEEIKNLLSEFNGSLKNIDPKHELNDIANRVDLINNKLDEDRGLDAMSDLLSTMTDSLNDIDTKLLAERMGYSDVRNEIDKLNASLTDLSGSIDSLKTVNAKDNAELDSLVDSMGAVRASSESVHSMLHDQNMALNALSRKSDSITESIIMSATDREVMEGRLQAELENLQNIVSMSGTGELAGKLDAVKKSVTLATTKVTKNQTKIDQSIKEFNAYLTRLNSIDYMLRLLQAKQLLKSKKRMPKWARDKKKSIEALIAAIEDEVADIMIVDSIPKTGMDLVLLSKSIGRTRRKTVERLAQLLAAGYIEERKIKRKKVYFVMG